MAIRSRFFSGTYYGQDDFKKMIKDGLTSGYVKGVGDGLKVTADGKSMVIQVGIGRGYLVGYSFDVMDEPYNLTVKGNTETDVRYDRVIAHMDEDSGITIVLKQGDSKNPPELVREGKIYEISLAKIKVSKNVGVITQDNITDERGNKSVCGIVGPHYDSLPIATEDTIGAVSVDTSNGLTISKTGLLGYNSSESMTYVRVGTSGETETVIGSITESYKTLFDGADKFVFEDGYAWSGTYTVYEGKITHNDNIKRVLYRGFDTNTPLPTPQSNLHYKIYLAVVEPGAIVRDRTGLVEFFVNGVLQWSNTWTGRGEGDILLSYNDGDTLRVDITNKSKDYVGTEYNSYIGNNENGKTSLLYLQYPEGTEVPTIQKPASQTDIDQDDLIAKIIEKIGGI